MVITKNCPFGGTIDTTQVMAKKKQFFHSDHKKHPFIAKELSFSK